MGEVFRRVFPGDCDVVVRPGATAAEGVVVVVRSRRPNPEWLREWQLGRDARLKVTDGELRGALEALVRAQPGRGATHYSRLTRAAGGPGGSQLRKEKLLAAMVAAGELRREPAPPGQRGRRQWVLRPGAVGGCPGGEVGV